jgi:hypothetical protein
MDFEDKHLKYGALAVFGTLGFVLFAGHAPVVNYDVDLQVDISGNSTDSDKASLQIMKTTETSEIVTLFQAFQIETQGCDYFDTPQEEVSMDSCQMKPLDPILSLV